MKRTRTDLYDRTIFSLTIEEIEDGERPGWVKRVTLKIEGKYVTMYIDAHWELSKYRAAWEYVKLKLQEFARQFGY